jgi:hypothetical protein
MLPGVHEIKTEEREKGGALANLAAELVGYVTALCFFFIFICFYLD